MNQPYDPNSPGGPAQGNPGPGDGDNSGERTEVVSQSGPHGADPTTVSPAPGTGVPPAAPTTASPTPPPGYAQPGYAQPGSAQPGHPQPGQQPAGYAPAGSPQQYGAQPTSGPHDSGAQYNQTQAVTSNFGQQGAAQPGFGQPGAGQQTPGQQGFGQPGPSGTQNFGQPGQSGPQGYGAFGGYDSSPTQFGQQPSGQPGQPQPGQYGPGDQFSGMGPGKSNKGLRTTMLAGAAVLAVVALILVLTALVWPGWGPKNLDQDAAQQGVQKVLTDEYQAPDVKDVKCPSGQRIKKDASFTCSVSVGGQNQQVKVTFLDDDGKYEVARPTS